MTTPSEPQTEWPPLSEEELVKVRAKMLNPLGHRLLATIDLRGAQVAALVETLTAIVKVYDAPADEYLPLSFDSREIVTSRALLSDLRAAAEERDEHLRRVAIEGAATTPPAILTLLNYKDSLLDRIAVLGAENARLRDPERLAAAYHNLFCSKLKDGPERGLDDLTLALAILAELDKPEVAG